MHAVGGGAGQAAGRLWTRGARCLPGPARSASPLWLQQRPQSVPLAWAPGPPTGRSFTGCWNPRQGCTSAPSPETWKVSLPAASTRTRPPDPQPLPPRGAQRRGSAGLGHGVGTRGALAGWAPGFQLQLRGRGRAGILPKARAPSSPGVICRDLHAARHRPRREPAEAGQDQGKAAGGVALGSEARWKWHRGECASGNMGEGRAKEARQPGREETEKGQEAQKTRQEGGGEGKEEEIDRRQEQKEGREGGCKTVIKKKKERKTSGFIFIFF